MRELQASLVIMTIAPHTAKKEFPKNEAEYRDPFGETCVLVAWHYICYFRGTMYSWPKTSQTLNEPSDRGVEASMNDTVRDFHDNADEVLEIPLLLSKNQILQLSQAAERLGMTSAQFLRNCISRMCGNPTEL